MSEIRKNWNFHNDVAIPLESIARKYISPDSERPIGLFYDADAIEAGSFVEVMLFLLRQKKGFEFDMLDFSLQCAPYLGKNGTSIPPHEANELFKQFRELYQA